MNLILYFFVNLAYLFLDAFTLVIAKPLKKLKIFFRIKKLKTLVGINPHDGRSLKELGMCLVEREKYSEALVFFQKAEEKMSYDAEFNYFYAVSLFRSGDQAKGKSLFAKAVSLAPALRQGDPYLMMAEAFINAGDFAGALPLLETFNKVHSSSSRGLYQLAMVKFKLGQKNEGVGFLKESIAAYKTSPFFKRKIDRKWAWKARLSLTQAYLAIL